MEYIAELIAKFLIIISVMIPGNSNTMGGATTTPQPNDVDNATKLASNDSLFASLAEATANVMGRNDAEKASLTQKFINSRVIDLPQNFIKGARMDLGQEGTLLLSLYTGKQSFDHAMSRQERTEMTKVLGDKGLSDEEKVSKITSMATAIAMREQMSNNFDQQMAQNQSQTNTMHR